MGTLVVLQKLKWVSKALRVQEDLSRSTWVLRESNRFSNGSKGFLFFFRGAWSLKGKIHGSIYSMILGYSVASEKVLHGLEAFF